MGRCASGKKLAMVEEMKEKYEIDFKQGIRKSDVQSV